MKKYFITGYSGFVGRHFLSYLDSLNVPVAVLGVDRDPVGDEFKIFRNLDCSFHKVDLLDCHNWASFIEEFEPDYIVHLASFSSVSYSWENPIGSFTNNTNVFLNLVEKVRTTNPKCRIISVGSSEEYGACTLNQLPLTEDSPLNPVSPYAVARVSQELLSKVYVDGFGCDIVMTRSFNHIGPGQSNRFVVPSFARQLKEIRDGGREPILITGDTSIVRDFVDVRDVVRAYDQLLKRGRSGQVYNVCSGKGVTLDYVIERMASILGVTVGREVDLKQIRPRDNKVAVGSPLKILAEIGWKSEISLDQSLTDILGC